MNNNNLIYNFNKIEELFRVNVKVEFDQVMHEMNNIFNGEVSFDIVHVSNSLFKYTLSTPLKTVCMFFEANNAYEINLKAKECFMNLVRIYFACKENDISPVATTKEEQANEQQAESVVNNIEQEQSNMEQINKVNQDAITQEQIDFINNFKKEFKIDTDEKFSNFIKTWNLTAKTSVRNKADLAHAGRKVVDSFISWVKASKENEQRESNFVIPSSEDVGCPW